MPTENLTPECAPLRTSAEVRDRLADALTLDLVGPENNGVHAHEALPGREFPSKWYLTGFLVPANAPAADRRDDDEHDELDAGAESSVAEESSDDRRAAHRAFFPSSIGLSFLVAPDASTLDLTARWGDYRKCEEPRPDGEPREVWKRTPREETVTISLGDLTEGSPEPSLVPDSGGLELTVVVRRVPGTLPDLPTGARSVSVFLRNRRKPDSGTPDLTYAFQAGIATRADQPFVPHPDQRNTEDADDRIADLHYRDTPEYAVGHGVSATWDLDGSVCREVRTAWVGEARVPRTDPHLAVVPDTETRMERLGEIESPEEVRAALDPLPARYRRWIAEQRRAARQLDAAWLQTANSLLDSAEHAADRIERGIERLAEDPTALDAFRTANRAVSRALRQRATGDADPHWRPFQLAFWLLNISGLADPDHPDREVVDLLFFPTGGGKTEAYLALAAFAMVLRRLRAERGPDSGVGVSVLMRYTLRLLTFDQLARATGLVCALELERLKDSDRYGEQPFEIGIWVGQQATPNRLVGRKGDQNSARTSIHRFQANPKGNSSPVPLTSCPWCGHDFTSGSFQLLPDDDAPERLWIGCANLGCSFGGGKGLPLQVVDETIYRDRPAFLIATADKFAALPWTGDSGRLLGGPPEAGISPPDLIIQDELHLISGPLGTMFGLYETVIGALCAEHGRAPKVVASTATARNAPDQVQAVFGRSQTHLFPPPGTDRRDSFFARTAPADDPGERLHLGIAAPGRNPKVLMRRVAVALMGAAERAFRDAGGQDNESNIADPYMTLLAYFNSLRELGGARRILEEEVQSTIRRIGSRKRIGEERGAFQGRRSFSDVVELTSRVWAAEVATSRRRLALGFHESGRVDCAIATNMIAAGLDIPRLGLMVVVGQPKQNAEYIQATSRVGRDPNRPGLVLTLFNIHKPRDRSHHERFRHYHDTFYRSVEPASVTPFSARALDRGFAGALVGLARHNHRALTTAEGAGKIEPVRRQVEEALRKAFSDRANDQPFSDQERADAVRGVHDRVGDLLDSWLKIAHDCRQDGASLRYQKHEAAGSGVPLLRDVLETGVGSAHAGKFRAGRSLREVEPEVNLFVHELDGA